MFKRHKLRFSAGSKWKVMFTYSATTRRSTNTLINSVRRPLLGLKAFIKLAFTGREVWHALASMKLTRSNWERHPIDVITFSVSPHNKLAIYSKVKFHGRSRFKPVAIRKKLEFSGLVNSFRKTQMINKLTQVSIDWRHQLTCFSAGGRCNWRL